MVFVYVKRNVYRYANNNMAELDQQLIAATEVGARHKRLKWRRLQ